MDNKNTIEEFLQSTDSDFLLSQESIDGMSSFFEDLERVFVHLVELAKSSDNFSKKKAIYSALAMQNAFVDKFKFVLDD